MSRTTVILPPIDGELALLVDSICEGSITPAERDRLEAILAEDQDAKLYYVAYMDLHAQVQWLTRGEGTGAGKTDVASSIDASVDPSFGVDLEPKIPNQSFPSLSTAHYPSSTNFVGGPVFSYMVASVVLCVMLLSAWAYKITHNPLQFVQPSPPLHLTEKPEFVFVGQVTDMRDCVWKDDNTATIVGASIRLGRKYSLAAGLMEITYKSGAVVILEGPCDYEVNSNIGGRLQSGKLVAQVGIKVASGQWLVASANPQAAPVPSPQSPAPVFSVTTPTAIVTDLGTEFGVEVAENGDTTSHVFRGSVEVRAIGGAAGNRIVIGKNESARVRRNSSGSAIVSRHVISDVGWFTCRMPRTVPLDVFNTGVNLREGDEDPHWEIVARSDDQTFEPRSAVVTTVKQPWFMPNDSQRYQWVSLAGDLPRVPNDVIYTFRTRFELPEIEGQSCNSAVLRCGFMADNHVDAIRFNGHPIEVPEHGRLSPFIRFHVFTVKEGIVPGENVLEFDVANGGPEEEGVGEEGSVSAMALVVELRGFAVYGGRASEKHPLPLNQPKGKEEVNK